MLKTINNTHSLLTFGSIEGHLTAKSDVYSFGVVLLEMLSGRRAVDQNRPSGEHSLVEWAKPYLARKRRALQIFDARIEGQYSLGGALKAVNLTIQCISTEPRSRPTMKEVVKALEQLQDSDNTQSSPGSQIQHHQSLNGKPSSNGHKHPRTSANAVSIGKAASYPPQPSAFPIRT